MPGRPRTGYSQRGDDFIASYERTLARAVEERVDLVLHAGDLFDSAEPHSRAVAAAAEPLRALAAQGIPVVVVPGNHERSVIPATLLLNHPSIHVLSTPRTVPFAFAAGTIAVSGFPCVRHASAARFDAALADTGWDATAAQWRVLLVHQTFEGAVCSPGNFRFRAGDDVVPRTAVPAAFDYVAAGHIHRHQVLASHPDGPPIVYAGASDRISFAELNEPKGAVLIELSAAGVTWRFLEHDVRPLCVTPIDVTGHSRAALLAELENRVRALPDDAVAQVRLTGTTQRATMRELALTQRLRTWRPDVLATVHARSVTYGPPTAPTRPQSTVFAAFPGPDWPTTRHTLTEVGNVPATCGVYVLRDTHGRLLYVGKADNLRTRVRTHLRGTADNQQFRGWTRQVAQVDTCAADSSFEALLLEAELIRRLRPPFNRQMRQWPEYCYLSVNGRPYGQLEICRSPTRHAACFGPLRGRRMAEAVREAVATILGLALCTAEDDAAAANLPLLADAPAARLCARYHAGVCAGPCAARIAPSDYDAALTQRDRLLAGLDDTPLAALEAALAAQLAGAPDDPALRMQARHARALRAAYTQSELLREAERLVDAWLILPADAERVKLAVLRRDGLQIRLLTPELPVLEAAQETLSHPSTRPCSSRLPAAVVDVLCLAAREARRAGGRLRFVPGEQVRESTSVALLAQITAFQAASAAGTSAKLMESDDFVA